MGQARARRLKVVTAASQGEPITIDLGEKTGRRLIALRARMEASTQAFEAIRAVHQQNADAYNEAIGAVLELHGVESQEGVRVNVEHDVRRDRLVVAPVPSRIPPLTEEPVQ